MQPFSLRRLSVFSLPIFLLGAAWLVRGQEASNPANPAAEFSKVLQPLLKQYCLDCHSTKAKKGSLDLERFATLDDLRRDVKPWQSMIEQIETGEMPPKGKPQPSEAQKKQLTDWVHRFLEAEAKARVGDPGRVPLRRLSNAEYDCTIRDLTGVDLKPTREFPADGAGGEGFTNAAESLSDISPALFAKYMSAAKDVADHAVLLPDGFRFSPSKTRRDWTDEGTAKLRKFYGEVSSAEGRLGVGSYLVATLRYKELLAAGKFEEAAAKEKINAKYLGILWKALNDATPSQPLDSLRAKWRNLTEKDAPALTADVVAWQNELWKTSGVGNYIRASWGAAPGTGYQESLTRQYAFDPPAVASAPLRVNVKPTPGQSEVVIHLAAHEAGAPGPIVWHRPRFEGSGKPTLLLRDYADFGPAFEVDPRTAFANADHYLAAVARLADGKTSPNAIAAEGGLDAALLRQWTKLLDLPSPAQAVASTRKPAPLALLEQKTGPNPNQKPILGWTKKGADLPVVLANASDKTLQIPGRVSGWTVGVHPTPQEFVGIAWKSPIDGAVQVDARVFHAHPTCGNGVAYWLEHRTGDRATLLGQGALDLGNEVKIPQRSLKVAKGDMVVLAVDPREGEHSCDMTEVWLTIAEEGNAKRVWDLGKDVAADIQAANPHADKHGNTETWQFVRGPSAKAGAAPKASPIPANSVLGRWRLAALSPDRKAEAEALAVEAAKVFSGARPGEKDANRPLYDRLVAVDSPLFAGVDVKKIAKRSANGSFGLPKDAYAAPDRDSLATTTSGVTEIRLPIALFVGRDFVVDARLGGDVGNRLVRVRAATDAPGATSRWDGPLLGSSDTPAYKQLVAGNAEFRKVFPLFTSFPQVVPTDEVVTLKMFHREDEPLLRMFLNAEQKRQLERLWQEQRFISRQPVAEYDYLPQFMGFTTQDTPKQFQQFFIDRKPQFKKSAEDFLEEERGAIPKQMEALLAFAQKAFRRPLIEKEKAELQSLYAAIAKKGASHDEAFRGALARVLVSPAFLFRIERAPKGKEPAAINDWELASRLSYFLWSSMPDDELRALASAGKLSDPKTLEAQTLRMAKDPKARSLAIEFGTQWIHVRGIDALKEKNEKLFPTFDAKLRKDIYEEAILFFQDLFAEDRPVANVLQADYAFLNDHLAKHYGIPGVTGSHFRKVDGIRKHGRGGILAMASVHAKQSGASRTSPVLRGNWVVETLLGEKLPRPPANVPILPDVEGGADKLTTRQMVERHVNDASCASCHVRIDPFGFAFEKFDPIGRLRTAESGGLPIDAKAKLRDGTEFEGIDGLRDYLMAKKKDVIARLFCQRLLGYALGRGVTLSDTALIDEMAAELNKNEGRVSAALLAIVRSPQFRKIRGADHDE
jgi:mono/diheme cytochrome c family protein